MTKKIIVVDNARWIDQTVAALESAGYTVEGFRTAGAAFTHLEQDPGSYALLITGGLSSGAIDGVHLLQLKANSPATNQIPAIYHGSIARGFLAFVETLSVYVQKDYNNKPPTFDRLLDQVRRLLTS